MPTETSLQLFDRLVDEGMLTVQDGSVHANMNACEAIEQWADARGEALANELREGYDTLDRNWDAMHSAAMTPIRAALGLPDGSVPELVQEIARLKGMS